MTSLYLTAGQLRGVGLDELPGQKMPGSAKHMLRHSLRQGRWEDRLYAGVSTASWADCSAFEEYED